MDHCRSCGAPIRWTISAKGRRLPIDPEPSPDGNITLEDRGQYREPRAVAHTVKAPDVVYYISHFATCPDAKKWRRKR